VKISAVIEGDTGVVTLTPNWLARLLGAKTKRGAIARTDSAEAKKNWSCNQRKVWFWVVTERVCEERIQHAIETCEVVDEPVAKVVRR
jgi:hypothetical protein